MRLSLAGGLLAGKGPASHRRAVLGPSQSGASDPNERRRGGVRGWAVGRGWTLGTIFLPAVTFSCACSSSSQFASDFPRQRGVSHSVETDAQQRLLTVYFSSGVTSQTLDPGFCTARTLVASLCAMRPRPTACIRLRMRLLSVTRRRLPRRFFLPTDPWRRSRHACSSTTHIAQRPQYIYSTAILPSSQHRTLLWRGTTEEGCGIS